MQLKLTISNILILISFIFTIAVSYNSQLYSFGMNSYFLNNGNYLAFLTQFFTSNFLHGGFMHLLFNAIFIGYFGNIVENNIGSKKYLLFFILNAFFVGIGVLILSGVNTVGISGFGLAVLTYYTFLLKSNNNDEYKGGITAIIINIGIGLTSGVSFIGHLAGAIFGYIYYFITKKEARKV